MATRRIDSFSVTAAYLDDSGTIQIKTTQQDVRHRYPPTQSIPVSDLEAAFADFTTFFQEPTG
jgi:hypothetical protein